MRGVNRLVIALCLAVSGLVMGLGFGQRCEAYEYAAPAWMDNEHIICVKYADVVKSRLFGWLGDITDARYIVVKEEIQFVSMDIEGKNEKVLKKIIIDYPGQSPKWREEIFKGVMRVDQIAYCPQRKLIAFSTHGFTERVYMINADGTGAKRIADVGGCPRFSPDGKYLQYTSHNIWLYDLDTGEQKVLIENAGAGVWSPDGKKIAIVRDLNKENNIYIYDLETKEEEKVNTVYPNVEDWAPDGKFIYYSKLLKYPKVSPDGTKVVGEPFSRYPPSSDIEYIGITDINGENLRVIR